MIISASYKTDIPTFYGEWFIRRLRAGYCKILNPFSKQISRVSLAAGDVDGFVFWTKNVGPFLKHLPEVKNFGAPFVVQHTINGYPRALEPSVVDPAKSIENVRRIAEIYGPRVCVWRYDTVVESSVTPRSFHEDTFARIAESLRGSTDEVVVSFAHLYKKTLRNMQRSAEEHGYEWTDPDDGWKRSLLSTFVECASRNGIRVSVCSQPQFMVSGSCEARCIDVERLQDVAGEASRIRAKEKGNRPECRCSEAKDIGDYDTCPHGCVYCYAVRTKALAQSRFRQHDPDSEFLFPPPPGASELPASSEYARTLFDAVGGE